MAFSKKAKIAVAVYQGVEIAGMHADHIKPKSKGGSDDVTNLQFLTPKVNMQKSDHYQELREWQVEFLDEWRKGKEQFLLVAPPGSGKTFAALTAAKEFIGEYPGRRIVIVVPYDDLTTQWREDAMDLGIDLLASDLQGVALRKGYNGDVVTYQSLRGTAGFLLQTICAHNEVIVILDEPHHCGEHASWGIDCKESFKNAKRKLLISGTPLRTDGQAIPFVTYHEEGEDKGKCKADYHYKHGDALCDKIIRNIVNEYHHGSCRLINPDGKEVEYKLNQFVPNEEAESILQYFLRTDGTFVKEQIRLTNNKLLSVREYIPDAAAMAVCMDQEHAKAVAKIIQKETRFTPEVVTSDEDGAATKLKNFRHSKKEWLVSVRMVSEGTDIKRLHVLCYLTNWATEVFFRQIIGRVSRYRSKNDTKQPPIPDTDGAFVANEDAYVFLPSDPRLIEWAKNLENDQKQGIKQDAERQLEKLSMNELCERQFPIFLDNEHLGSDVTIISDRQYSPYESSIIEDLRSCGVSIEKAESQFNKIRHRLSGQCETQQSVNRPRSKQEEEKGLSLQVQSAVRTYVRIKGLRGNKDAYMDTYNMLKRKTGQTSEKPCGDQLRSQLKLIFELIRDA